jgi:hypothetical protein
MRGQVIDRPWAIVYGPRCKLGTGLMYGLGLTRVDAWNNAVLVYSGVPWGDHRKDVIAALKKKGMIARRVAVVLEEKGE